MLRRIETDHVPPYRDETLAKDLACFPKRVHAIVADGWLRGGLSMRHKPPLDSCTAGIIGLGLLPIAMAFAAILIP